MKRRIALCLAVVAALAGTSHAHAELITGAGSTFAFPILGQWAKAYRVAKTDGADFIPHDIGVDYEPIGSLGGEVRINQRGIDFGATDRPLASAELERNGLGQFPIVMGGVVPVVNIDGVAPGQLKLTGAVLADIFLGKIANWSDPAIKAINPERTLPDAKITVAHRSDGSGTTFNFASYLAKVSPEWRDKVGADTLVKWPTGTGAEGNQGVANLVLRTKNAIGYVEYGQVIRASLAYALVQNRAGNFIKPDAASLQAAAASAEWGKAKDFSLLILDAPGEQAYPIAATTFILMHKKPSSVARSREALRFFRLSLETGARDASALGYVPLPDALVKQVKDYWAATFERGG
jgi:phosphate transport system substrate-binding protein